MSFLLVINQEKYITSGAKSDSPVAQLHAELQTISKRKIYIKGVGFG